MEKLLGLVFELPSKNRPPLEDIVLQPREGSDHIDVNLVVRPLSDLGGEFSGDILAGDFGPRTLNWPVIYHQERLRSPDVDVSELVHIVDERARVSVLIRTEDFAIPLGRRVVIGF